MEHMPTDLTIYGSSVRCIDIAPRGYLSNELSLTQMQRKQSYEFYEIQAAI